LSDERFDRLSDATHARLICVGLIRDLFKYSAEGFETEIEIKVGRQMIDELRGELRLALSA
jgi:hypothetical protein